MSTNSQLIERATRHQIMVQRLGSSHVKDAMPLLKGLAKELSLRINDAPTEFQYARMTSLLGEVGGIISAAADEMNAQLMLNLEEFATYEADFTQRTMAGLVSADLIAPTEASIIGAVTRNKYELVSGKKIQRLGINQLVGKFADNKRKEIETAIRGAYVAGFDRNELARQVQDIAGVKAQRQAEALIRTATNMAGSAGRDSFYQANADVIDHEEWVSTLDNRTTIVCAGLDGKLFPVGEGVYPPRHYNCRSIRIPVVKPEYTVSGTDKGERASTFGPVGAQKTYGGFLKDQSDSFQDDVLGEERAKLFRSGKVTIDKFTDDMGRTLTLKDLKAREGLTLDD